jgi:hypothetical protein
MGSRGKNGSSFLLDFIQKLMKTRFYSIVILSSLIFFWSGSFSYAQDKVKPYSKQEINEQLEQAILEIDFELVHYILKYASERKLDGANDLNDKLIPKPNKLSIKHITNLKPTSKYVTAQQVVAAIFNDYLKLDKVIDKNIVDKIYQHTNEINNVTTFQGIEKLLNNVTQTAIIQIGQYNTIIEQQKGAYQYRLPSTGEAKELERKLISIKEKYLTRIAEKYPIDFSYQLQLPNNEKYSITTREYNTTITYTFEEGKTEERILLTSTGNTSLSISASLATNKAFKLKRVKGENEHVFVISYDTTQKGVEVPLTIRVNTSLNSKDKTSKSIIQLKGLPKPAPPQSDVFEYKVWRGNTGEITPYTKYSTIENSSTQKSNFVYKIDDVQSGDKLTYQDENGKFITEEVETENKLITIEFPNQNFERSINISPRKVIPPYSTKLIYIVMATTIFIVLFIIIFFTTRKSKNSKIEERNEPIGISEKVEQLSIQKSDEEIIFKKYLYELKSVLRVLINTNQSAQDKFSQANTYYQKAIPKIQNHSDIKALMATIKLDKEAEEKQETKDKIEHDKRFNIISEATREAEQKIKEEEEREIVFNRDLSKLKNTLEIVIASKQSAKDKFHQANEHYRQHNGKIQQNEEIQDLMFKIRKSKEIQEAEEQKNKIEETKQEEVKETVQEPVIPSDFEKQLFYLSSKDSLEKVKELEAGRNKAFSSTIFIIEQISENEATLETYTDIKSSFFTSFYHTLYNFEFAFDVLKRPSTAPTSVKTKEKGKLIKERNIWKVVEKAKIEFY